MAIKEKYMQIELLRNCVNTSKDKMMENRMFKNIYLASTALLGAGTCLAFAGSEGIMDFFYGFGTISGMGTVYSFMGQELTGERRLKKAQIWKILETSMK